MTENEIITLAVSLVSLSISIFVGYKTYIFSEYQLRLSNRNEFQKMLIDVDKILVEHPELWAVYDSHPVLRNSINDPKERARLEAFAYLILNMYECVFSFYGDSPRLTRAEQASFTAWKGFFNDSFQKSPLMREILNRTESRIIYNANLIAEVDAILQRQRLESGPEDTSLTDKTTVLADIETA